MEYHIPLSRVREIYRSAKSQDAKWGHIDAEAWYREREIAREKLAIAEQRIAELETEMRILGECVATLDDENAALRQENRKLALAVSQLTLAKAELEREMVALIGPDSDSPLVRDSATPPGNVDPAWVEWWRAEVAAWDALADEAAALIDAPSDAP